MKNTNSVRLAAALICILGILPSCGAQAAPETPQKQDTTPVTEETTAPVEEKLSYPSALSDHGGETFTFLNCVDGLWAGSFHVIDYEEASGDAVESAIYRRARQAEEDLNLHIAVEKDEIGNLYGRVKKTVTSGDNAFAAAYMPLQFGSATLAGEYALNLYDLGTLRLSEPWWNQSYVEQTTLGDDILFASIDYINMMGYTYTNVMYFNKKMCENYDLDYPYQAVRDGKWTYDAMREYMAAAVNLNGDSAFSEKNPNCVFGYAVQHEEGTMTLLDGCGSFVMKKNKDGIPVINDDLTQLSAAYEKLLSILERDGFCMMGNGSLQENTGSISLFANSRAMFHQAALGVSAADFRNIDVEYGILPMPKADESQEKYYSMVSQYTLALSVPKTATEPAKTGEVLDYMAFLGYRDVIPEVQTALCFKGLRDEDSIDMFNIVLDTESVDIGFLFGWTSNLVKTLSQNVYKGKNDFASQMEKNASKIEKAVEKTLTAMELG